MPPAEPIRSQRPDLVLRAVEREGIAIYTPMQTIDRDSAGTDVGGSNEVGDSALDEPGIDEPGIDEPGINELGLDDVLAAGRVIFGDDVVIVADQPPIGEPTVARCPVSLHTDGAVHGNHYPEYLLLACAQALPGAGNLLAVDGHAVLAKLAARAGGADLISRMSTVLIDQTEPGTSGALSSLIGRTARGRLMLRRFPYQAPSPDSASPERDAEMIESWQSAVADAAQKAARFAVSPGEVVVLDNYRMMHGAEASPDAGYEMRRAWAWTSSAYGPPE